MGASCPQSRSGLVGTHAYSLIDVRMLCDYTIGRQLKMDSFLGGGDGVSAQASTAEAESARATGGPLRLVKLRNPWGRTEWKGAFGARTEQWTSRLRRELDQRDANDGAFWMLYDDFLAHFSTVDVCKTHRGWHEASLRGALASNLAA